MENEKRGTFRFFIKLFRGWKSIQDRFASALDVDLERKVEIYTQLTRSATSKDIVYWLQIFFSAGISTLGLVLDSTAVVIGAMLISPLMAPILSQGLSLATGDLILGVRALANLTLSTLLGVGLAVVLVALLPFKDLTPEIIARTEPNTLDLGIALFSGAIGAVAICRDVKGVATSIPGVAIAVALMPPLCVIGFGLGYAISVEPYKGWEIASGGGLLYLTNLVAITFTAMLVFVLLRVDTAKVREVVHKWRDDDSESQWWIDKLNKIPALEKAREVRSFSLRILMILLPLLIIFFPLSTSFSKMRAKITKRQSENQINQFARKVWKDNYELDSEDNVRSYIDDLRINETADGQLQVYLRVFGNRPYTVGERKAYVARLAKQLGRKPEEISLQLVEIPTSERTESKPIVEATPTPLSIAQQQVDLLQEINNKLSGFRLPPPADIVSFNVTIRSNGLTYLEVYYLSERDIDTDGESSLSDLVRNRLTLPNMGLVLTRINSTVRQIRFENRSAVLTEESIKILEETADDLGRHPSLQARIMMQQSESNDELAKKRQATLTELFVQNNSISSKRLVFGEAGEEDSSATVQLFVRK
ncbi:MAG: DUF389 domain-containing protein [Pyrinomonadaceae bacterium]|nr:DUF389 domain-containing protein [Pyrinomonadaceae bacterium]